MTLCTELSMYHWASTVRRGVIMIHDLNYTEWTDPTCSAHGNQWVWCCDNLQTGGDTSSQRQTVQSTPSAPLKDSRYMSACQCMVMASCLSYHRTVHTYDKFTRVASANVVEPRLTEQSMPEPHPHTATVLKCWVFEPHSVWLITSSSHEEAPC